MFLGYIFSWFKFKLFYDGRFTHIIQNLLFVLFFLRFIFILDKNTLIFVNVAFVVYFIFKIFYYPLIDFIFLQKDKLLDFFQHYFHRFLFNEFDCHLKLFFVIEIERSFTAFVLLYFNVFESKTCGFTWVIKKYVLIVIFNIGICPWLEKPFSFDLALFIND